MTGREELLRSLLDRVSVVFFDFDGPLCDVFSGYPALEIARELENIAGERFDTDDPLDVLERAAAQNNSNAKQIEDALITAEVRAIGRSSPNASGVSSLQACLNSGLRVGIVSNNSSDAVGEFLKLHNLSESVYPIVGRAYRRPDLMKPNEWPLRTALRKVNCVASQAVFIGDSSSDVEVAKAVAMPCVAYANKPGKRKLFESMGAITIDSMYELERAVAD